MDSSKYLSDNEITLRLPEPYDLDTILEWENDTEAWNVGTAHAPFSRAVIEEFIANYDPDIYTGRQLRLIITLNDCGRAIGAIDLYDFDPHNRRAGIGIMISREYRRHGYGSKALSLLIGYCRDVIGTHQTYAMVPVDNEASINLFKKAGFNICGRYRSWLRRGIHYTDVFTMQLLF